MISSIIMPGLKSGNLAGENCWAGVPSSCLWRTVGTSELQSSHSTRDGPQRCLPGGKIYPAFFILVSLDAVGTKIP